MTGMAVTLFVLAAVLVAMTCVKADWIRSVRSRTHPSGEELSTSTFVVARVTLLVMAALCIWQGADATAMSADSEWSDDELTSAVRETTDDLDGWMYRDDGYTTKSAYFDDYESLLRDKVVRYGGGGAPQTGVNVTPAPTNSESDASFTLSASGTSATFCTHIQRTRSKKDDHTPPGIAGGESSITERAYVLGVASRVGEC
ncbi:hypothetical protein AB0J38_42835 [Streptomyces sp. NPDC050095]|uniref:hypothetical protein n=1 Tax=unclassified Streptomyces TaxID=2593676 RepID=UPI003427B57C